MHLVALLTQVSEGVCDWFCVTPLLLPLSPTGERTYNRDLFMFILTIILFAGVYSTEVDDKDVHLNRAQTEEWKGWMQVCWALRHKQSMCWEKWAMSRLLPEAAGGRRKVPQSELRKFRSKGYKHAGVALWGAHTLMASHVASVLQ
jgi:hypothetical protein